MTALHPLEVVTGRDSVAERAITEGRAREDRLRRFGLLEWIGAAAIAIVLTAALSTAFWMSTFLGLVVVVLVLVVVLKSLFWGPFAKPGER
jgi:cobalamin biosynthesis protein CobD/CbiB